jgi:hypothetical protein
LGNSEIRIARGYTNQGRVDFEAPGLSKRIEADFVTWSNQRCGAAPFVNAGLDPGKIRAAREKLPMKRGGSVDRL